MQRWLPRTEAHLCACKHTRTKRILAVPVTQGSQPSSETVIVGDSVSLPTSSKCDLAGSGRQVQLRPAAWLAPLELGRVMMGVSDC